jgi:hypothetical protein
MKGRRENISEETRLTLRLPRFSIEDLEKIKEKLGTSSDNEAARRMFRLGALILTEGTTVSITDERGTRGLDFI